VPKVAPLAWDGARLHILDQTLLPGQERMVELAGARDTAAAIRRLSVRGAPLIGVAAAYGLAMEVAAEPSLGALERGWEELRRARPTAANLAWAVDRVRGAALSLTERTGRGGPRRGRGESTPRRMRPAPAWPSTARNGSRGWVGCLRTATPARWRPAVAAPR
jgi:hypothetical protein